MELLGSLLLAAFPLALQTPSNESQPAPWLVIPQPKSLAYMDGEFCPQEGLAVRFDARVQWEAEFLAERLREFTGFPVPTVREELRILYPQEIHLEVLDSESNPTQYQLLAHPERIHVAAPGTAGVWSGIQTLLQVWPTEPQACLRACLVTDEPRFAWRGLHLDVGRHWFAKDDILSLLDWMAVHKLNVFHWHLTEDQGWRLEIKKYPKLTSVGAYRASTPPYGDRRGSDGERYGGFYTQAEVREIVRYAAQRHITVVPEIDMPGHMAAAIAAYPELGNDDIPDYDPQVQTHWGVKPYTLSPKEETFAWIDDVFEEVCDLFPSTYVHVGGDEAPKGQWKQSAFAQSVMQREHLHNEDELQAYFLGRVSKLLEKRGRKMLGWDEIREGGLAPGATVMVWRGWNHAVAAAQAGHDVIMAPTSHTYFDYYQADPKTELTRGDEYECIGGFLPLEKVYAFEPIPKELLGSEAAQRILGCQGQLWTEYVKTWDKLEYLAWPRVCALAEVAWTQPTKRDWNSFQQRLRPMLARLQAAGVRTFDPFAEPEPAVPAGQD